MTQAAIEPRAGFMLAREPRTEGRLGPAVTWSRAPLNYVPPKATHQTYVRFQYVGRGKPLPLDDDDA